MGVSKVLAFSCLEELGWVGGGGEQAGHKNMSYIGTHSRV